MNRALVARWVEAREPPPPVPLRERLQQAVAQASDGAIAHSSVAACTAAIAREVLARVLESDDRARETAQNLLVADALITYAIEAQVAGDVEQLDAFAASVSV